MEMEEDIEDFMEEEDFYLEASEIDWDYEFDAAHYFDFSHPETSDEAQEAERWFAIAGNYPASPLITKLKRGGISCSSLEVGYAAEDVDSGSHGCCSSKGEDGSRKTRSSRALSTTLMKPTASHLAKLTKSGHVVCERLQKSPIHMDERGLQTGCDNLATKRQKLEIGYLCKVSQMRHQALLLHKKSKKDGNAAPNAAPSKLKVTIPKEPALQTLQRAKSRRSGATSESSERSELDTTQLLQSRSVNRKMLKPPSPIPPTTKSKQKLTEFQEFNFKTAARALQRSSTIELNRLDSDAISLTNPADWKRSNSENTLKKEKSEKPLRTKSGTYSNKIYPTKEDTGRVKNTSIKEATVATQESKHPKDDTVSQNPPTELFKKLSLRSELTSDTISHPKSRVSAKGSKENSTNSFQPDFWRCVGKLNHQCGGVKTIPGIAYQSNVNRRSLGFR